MKHDKTVLYMHAGSGNHGCEALVNTICKMLDKPSLVVTNSVQEDETYSLRDLAELVQERKIAEHKIAHILYYIWRKVTKDEESFLRYRFRAVTGRSAYPFYLSIGGDNYCYDMMVKDLILANRMFNRQGSRTVLLGCSIEPELLKQERICQDMKQYHAIFARESITYEALLAAGIDKNTYLFPDSAFTLEQKQLPLPEAFLSGNTIGINLSPMIMENEAIPGITMQNFKNLITYILETTQMNILLIPHVVWKRSDDRRPIGELYEAFRETGRVSMIEDGSCEELKGYISRCRMFIGARTHATIAAYSSCVPTLVVGYSVKAKGIAKDLFGTYENYVIPVQTLARKEDLIHAFDWLCEQEQTQRAHLTTMMPAYIEQAQNAGKKLRELESESGYAK